MSRLDIINVVYGETFTNFFVEVSLPSQLSPGNIPALREAAHSAYNIYTTKADAPVIRAARSFQALERLMPVNLVELSMEEIRDPAYRERMGMTVWSILSMIHKQAIQQARHDTLVFLAPDWVIADGSFAAIEARIDQGYEAVVISGPRIDWDRAESTFRGWVRDGEHLAVPGRILVDMMLKFPHPVLLSLTHDMRWHADMVRSNWPSMFIWFHPEVGLISHSCHLHPIAVKRTTGNADFTTTIDGDYLSRFSPGSDRIYFAADSDEICIADFTPQSYGQQSMLDPPQGIFFLAHWLHQNAPPINRWFMETPFLFKSSGCKEESLQSCRQITCQRIRNTLELSRCIFNS